MKLTGKAFLCFLEDRSAFQGNLVVEDKVHYGLAGKLLEEMPEDADPCILYEGETYFYTVTLVDHSTSTDTALGTVFRTGGDNCALSSDSLNFRTHQLVVGQKAEDLIGKYFSSSLKGRDCCVCLGEMEIDLPS